MGGGGVSPSAKAVFLIPVLKDPQTIYIFDPSQYCAYPDNNKIFKFPLISEALGLLPSPTHTYAQ